MSDLPFPSDWTISEPDHSNVVDGVRYDRQGHIIPEAGVELPAVTSAREAAIEATAKRRAAAEAALPKIG
jgi:hypothetical protein